MNKKTENAPKLTFNKPSGQSRLTNESKNEIMKEEVKRVALDLPLSMAIELKIKSAKESISVREIVINAINEYLNK
jgi:hypothetical protein